MKSIDIRFDIRDNNSIYVSRWNDCCTITLHNGSRINSKDPDSDSVRLILPYCSDRLYHFLTQCIKLKLYKAFKHVVSSCVLEPYWIESTLNNILRYGNTKFLKLLCEYQNVSDLRDNELVIETAKIYNNYSAMRWLVTMGFKISERVVNNLSYLETTSKGKLVAAKIRHTLAYK